MAGCGPTADFDHHLLDGKLNSLLGVSKSLVAYRQPGPDGAPTDIKTAAVTTEAAAIPMAAPEEEEDEEDEEEEEEEKEEEEEEEETDHPDSEPSTAGSKSASGELLYLGYCSVDNRSRAAALSACTWLKCNEDVITKYLEVSPVVDLQGCFLRDDCGRVKCGVDIIVRLASGLQSVMQTASLVVALVAMAWNLPSKVDISVVGDVLPGGALMPFPGMLVEYLDLAAVFGLHTVVLPTVNVEQLNQALERQPLDPNDEFYARMVAVKVVGCETMLDVIRHVYSPGDAQSRRDGAGKGGE